MVDTVLSILCARLTTACHPIRRLDIDSLELGPIQMKLINILCKDSGNSMTLFKFTVLKLKNCACFFTVSCSA
jgi:hypothetical protein